MAAVPHQHQNRTSNRFSTYSMAPSIAPTVQSNTSNSSSGADFQKIEKGLDRMENKALGQQRVTLSEEKSAYFSKLALGAKLDRALDRRLSGQDAVMKEKKTRVLEKEVLVEQQEQEKV